MSSRVKVSGTTTAGSELVPKLRFPEFQDTPGWALHKLGDICELYQPETISSSEFVSDGQYLVYGANGVVGRLDRYNHEFEEVAISCRGYCGEIHFTKPFSWVTGNAMIASPSVSYLSKPFLYRLLAASDMTPIITGSAQPQITRQGISRFLIALPLPSEQQKIADFLASSDALIEVQGRKVEALRAHKQGLMQQLFPQEGETQPRLRFPEFEGTGDWEEGTISDIGTVLQGYGFPERYQGQQSGDFPFYKVSDISRSLSAGKTFIEKAANYVDENQLKELRAKPIPAGTTVFAKIGEAIRSDKRAITTVPCLIDNNAAGVKSIRGKATDFFIYLTMEQISLIDHAGGVVPAVNKSAIEAIPVKFPKVEEQRRIADCLTSLDVLISAESQKLGTLKTHKKGLMQQLFPHVREADA